MTHVPLSPLANTTVAVVLAAGRSTRLGTPKQLLPWRGTTLVRHTVDAVHAAGIVAIAVVVGHAAAAVEQAVAGGPAVCVENAAYSHGQGTSVVCGVHWAQERQAAHILFVTCDQPYLRADHIQLLLAQPPAPVRMLRVAGQPCPPSLWAASTFPLLAQLTGDSGGRALIQRGLVAATYTDCDAPELLIDIDTPEDYAALCAR